VKHARDKRSSLLRKSVNYGQKSFISSTPGNLDKDRLANLRNELFDSPLRFVSLSFDTFSLIDFFVDRLHVRRLNHLKFNRNDGSRRSDDKISSEFVRKRDEDRRSVRPDSFEMLRPAVGSDFDPSNG